MSDSGPEIKILADNSKGIDPKPKGIDWIKSQFQSRKITFVDTPEQLNDFDDLVKILNEPLIGEDISTSINVLENQHNKDSVNENVEVGTEPLIRIAMSMEINQKSADAFFKKLRSATREILGGNANRENYSNNEWYGSNELRFLANRWAMPLALVVQKENHYLLMLKPPEIHEDSYSALVYDPILGGERYYQLPNWDNSYSIKNIFDNSIYLNDQASEELRIGTYDLSLFGDEEIAQKPEAFQAIMAKVQFDASNCGPACLFAAALRLGAQKGWNAFKDIGKEILEKDTGLKVLTREEILSQT